MREKERIDRITKKIGIVWKMYPDWRFYQVLFNFGFLERAEVGRVYDPFNKEDDKVEALLDKIISGEVKI